jgi:DNA-binding transcriptional MocR family regulator
MSERFLALPFSMLDEMREHLTAEQQIMLLGLLREANYHPSTVRVRGQKVQIDTGELLLAQRRIAARLGASRSQVQRLIRRLEALGWISVRQALPAPEAAPTPAPKTAPSPTILRVRKWRRILWTEAQAAPGAAPEPAPEAAPILPSTIYPIPNYFSLARENKDADHEPERECSLEDIDRILRPWKERKHG